jgi:hypothetical protein
MFPWLSGIKWFEWMLVGLVTAVGLGAYLLYGINQDLKQNVAIQESVIETFQETQRVQTESIKITDTVVTELVSEKVGVLKRLDQSRTGAIDEYLTDNVRVVDPHSGNIDEVPEPRKVVVKIVQELVEKPPPPKTNHGNDRDNLALHALANRMWEHYCLAKDPNGHCDPESPHSRL